MNWIPEPWTFALLALGSFRAVRIIGWDSISEPARKLLTGYTDEGAPSISDAQRARHGKVRVYLSSLVRCPWCIGTYVCLTAYGLWLWVPTVTLALCVPAALGSIVGLIAKNLDP